MKRVLLVLIIFFLGMPCGYAEEFDVSSNYIILYNLNDKEILYEKDSEEKVPIASLTKIMTAIVAIEQNADLEEKVEITSRALSGLAGYSKAGFNEGDVVTVRDLLYGVLLPSGADAVQALAMHTSGMITSFVDLMNDKARQLKMENTSFDNPIGMDGENNYSTAEDLAILLNYALENETFREIFTTRNYTVSATGKTLQSTLIGYAAAANLDISLIDGAKSGYTPDAGYCLASIAQIDGVDYLLVTLNGDVSDKSSAVKDSLTIYDYYSSNYSYQEVLGKGEVIKKLPIKLGTQDTYEIKADTTLELYLENETADDIEIQYEGITELKSSIKKGDKLGDITFFLDEQELYTYEVFLEDDISYHHPVLYVLLVFVAIILLLLIRKKIRRMIRKRRRKKAH